MVGIAFSPFDGKGSGKVPRPHDASIRGYGLKRNDSKGSHPTRFDGLGTAASQSDLSYAAGSACGQPWLRGPINQLQVLDK
jgi:hypothetical protein